MTQVVRKVCFLVVALVLLFTPQSSFAISNEEARKVNALMFEGLDLLKQNKTEEGLEKLRAARDLAPAYANVLINYALGLMRTNRNDEAIATLKEAIRLDPTIPAAWVNLATIYQTTNQTKLAIEAFENYVKRFPNDDNAEKARSLISILKSARSDNATNSDTASNPDYFSAVIKTGIQKWPPDRLPLKVYISDGSSVKGYQPSFATQVENGFNDWQEKSNKTVSFVFQKEPKSADIIVNWTDDPKKVLQLAEAGDCRCQFYTDGINLATITLLLNGTDAIPLDDFLLRWAALHEIGHALGLEGHSVNPADIMYYSMTFDYPKKVLSPRDIATLVHLYRPDVKAAGDPNYMFNDAVHDFNGLIKLPQAERNYIPVIEKFEKVRIRFPDFAPTKAPLALCYANHGTTLSNQNNFAEAASFFKKALSNLTSENSQSDKLLIRKNYAYVLKKLHRDADAEAVLSGKNP